MTKFSFCTIINTEPIHNVTVYYNEDKSSLLSSVGIHSTSKNYEVSKMIKSVFAATAALSMSAGAAFAGPYVNVETNAGWTGSDYNGAATDLHVGYEGSTGRVGYYIQGGPQIQTPDGADNEVVFSGKAGGSVAATERLSFYGELSLVTGAGDADNGYGGKIGTKFNF